MLEKLKNILNAILALGFCALALGFMIEGQTTNALLALLVSIAINTNNPRKQHTIKLDLHQPKETPKYHNSHE
jgi:hypothetical protein